MESTSNPRMSAEERHRQLLSAARELFTRKGYRATTAEVARAAGVSEALVVKHFGSKEELFRAAIAEPIGTLVEWALHRSRQAAQLARPREPAEHFERLVTFGATWAATVAEHRALLLAAIRESARFPQAAAQLDAMVRELVEEIARMLERFSGSGPFTEFEPRFAIQAAIGALTMGGLYAEDPAAFARRYFEMALLGVLTPESRRALDR